MAEIEIYRVDVMPDREQVLGDIPRAVGFLLTRVLSLGQDHGQALLHAEARHAEPEVTWYLRRRGGEGEGEDSPVGTVPIGILSSVLARLALAFDIDYVAGGCGRGTIVFEGRRFDCRVFLSKSAACGYWIRFYVATAKPPGA